MIRSKVYVIESVNDDGDRARLREIVSGKSEEYKLKEGGKLGPNVVVGSYWIQSGALAQQWEHITGAQAAHIIQNHISRLEDAKLEAADRGCEELEALVR